MQRRELEGLTREELIARAERLAVARPRVLTQAELMDEILSRTATSDRERARSRGWLGRARDLLASVVERGLHLPEAARALSGRPPRGSAGPARFPSAPPPLPTVTLAEIYAAQGHLDRAVAVLGDVLEREPDHDEAKRLRDRFIEQAARRPASPGADASPAASAASTGSGLPDPGDDAPLPDRYDVDEVVAIAVDPATVYLYWEVRPVTLARARARRPEGRLAVRAVCVSPSWDGPSTATREVPIDALFGDLFVRDVTPGSNVRVTVGWLAGADFEPFAVGDELSAPRLGPAETVGHAVARWSPDPLRGVVPGPRRQLLGTALQRMRQQVGHDPVFGSGDSFFPADPNDPLAPLDFADLASAGPDGVSFPGGRVRRTVTTRRLGSSELVRLSHDELLAGGGRPGGASELSRGGASDLRRR